MAFWSNWFGGAKPPAASPRASFQGNGGGVVINTPELLEEALRAGSQTASGTTVTASSAMRVAAVYACVRIRSGVVANMPIHIKRRIDDRTREDASDLPLWRILRKKPNGWQTAAQFKRMMQAHLLLRGNACALIVRSRGIVQALIPLHPDRLEVQQNDDLSLTFTYTRVDGRRVQLKQQEVFHLVGMTFDGVHGVSVIAHARQTIGLSMAMEEHGATVFRNGARVSNVLTHPNKLGREGLEFLRASLDDYRAGGESEGKALILEEGMTVTPLAMTSEDAQWLEARRFSRTDIAMFFGVPPHMIGDTEKSTSWGTGIEAQTQGFITFSAEDDLTIWEETIDRDLIGDGEPDIYARFNRNALVRSDLKTRTAHYVAMLQWGVYSPNKVLELEDENPRPDGDVWYPPPNTAGKPEPDGETGPDSNDPEQSKGANDGSSDPV